MGMTVAEIRDLLRSANADEFAALERSLAADTRKGVRSALEICRRRIAAREREARRIEDMYRFDEKHNVAGGLVVGMDEVGRGAVAGPLAVGAVILSADTRLSVLDDSKQLSPELREQAAKAICASALAWHVAYISPERIDAEGMSASLRAAFAEALAGVEAKAEGVTTVLIDGNRLGIDEREQNVVKGDSASASIAAASIVAKVERDALMDGLSSTYPQYGFSQNKGYGSAAHVEAIRENGLSAVHRRSFCKSFLQETLF